MEIPISSADRRLIRISHLDSDVRDFLDHLFPYSINVGRQPSDITDDLQISAGKQHILFILVTKLWQRGMGMMLLDPGGYWLSLRVYPES
jgi:hypothetical protein